MEKLRIGVIGLGGISQLNHLPNLSRIKDVVINGVAEIKSNTLQSVSEKFNIKNKFADYREMLRSTELDAVLIATPTGTHKEIALDCLNAGKHVMIEKPIATSSAEAEEIAATAKNKGLVAVVGMNMRFRPDIMLLKSVIQSGEIGEIFHINCGWLRPRSSEGKWFTEKSKAGGGVILDLGIVLLDISLWLMKYPAVKNLSTQNYTHRPASVEDTSVSFIRCENEKLITMETSWTLSSEKNTFYMNIYGSKGNAFVNPLRIVKQLEDGTTIDMTPSKTENSARLYKKSYENEIRHFIGAVKGLNPDVSPCGQAVDRMKVIEYMYQSASNQSEVRI